MAGPERQRVVIVDDEPPARERLRALLAELGHADVIGEAGAGDDAVRMAAELRPDVLLLDVRMPGMSGLEAARHIAHLDQPPAIIFTTAYDAYAVEAFEAEAVGYLLKPVRSERLAAALERAARLGSPQLARLSAASSGAASSGAAAPRPEPRTHIAVRLRDSIKLVPLSEIYHFTADQKYTTVRHKGGSDLIDDPLKELEAEFDTVFVRVHRNALVRLSSIAALERTVDGQHVVVVRETGERIAVSRRMAGELKERLGL